MAYVKVGYWCNYTILSTHPVTEDDIRFSTNFKLRLMQYRHVRGAVIEHVIDSVDVVYPEFFHYQHECFKVRNIICLPNKQRYLFMLSCM